MSNSIMYAPEIKFHAPFLKSFTGIEWQWSIELIETKEFTENLTHDFWELLLADRSITDPTAVARYDKTETYVQGQIVLHDDRFWQVNCTSIAAGVAPPCDCWGLVPKFKTTCYENLFHRGGLARYLSLIIGRENQPLIDAKMTPSGTTQALSTKMSFQPASKSARDASYSRLDAFIRAAYIELIRYIHRDTSGCFDTLANCLPCACEGCCGRIEVNQTKLKSRAYVGGTEGGNYSTRDRRIY